MTEVRTADARGGRRRVLTLPAVVLPTVAAVLVTGSAALPRTAGNAGDAGSPGTALAHRHPVTDGLAHRHPVTDQSALGDSVSPAGWPDGASLSASATAPSAAGGAPSAPTVPTAPGMPIDPPAQPVPMDPPAQPVPMDPPAQPVPMDPPAQPVPIDPPTQTVPIDPPARPVPCPAVTPGCLTQTPATRPRTVALTFDDGPGPWTPRFLAVLARHHVHGTFFMVATRAQARPDLVAQVVDAGNLVGNHTWSHPLHPPLSILPAAALDSEIGDAQAALTRLSGSPPCFFRAPGENHRTPAVQAVAHRFGLTVTDTTRTAGDAGNPLNAGWNPAWRNLIVARVTAAGDHPIVLMHDGHDDDKINELSALEAIITWYAARGYAFTDPAGRAFPAG